MTDYLPSPLEFAATPENPLEIVQSVLRANHYLMAATSNNTRKAYQADIRHFETWGGQLPTTTEVILRYLQAFAPILNPSTLARRLIALKHWHNYQHFPDPTYSPLVAKTITGILRIHGKPKEKAAPLSPEQLLQIVGYLAEQNTLSSIRDSALLQIGFLGAFRRSELVGLYVEHIDWQSQGIEILIPQSKTDQTHQGQYCAIPYGNDKLCAISALSVWLERTAIKSGAIFRRIFRNNKLSEFGLTPISVNHILQKHAKAVKLANADSLSSHSLRRGLATTASRDGVPLQAIMQQGRWKQVSTVMEYIDAAGRFETNAAGLVVQHLSKKDN